MTTYMSPAPTTLSNGFDGSTGAYLDDFVSAGSGGLAESIDLIFGPDGNLYVSNYTSDQVLVYDGQTGALIGDFITPGAGGLDGPTAIQFLPSHQVAVAATGAEIVVPIAQSVDEDQPLTFSTGGGNSIVLNINSSSDPLIVATLSVSQGSLTLGSTLGITFLNGTSNGDALLTIAGTESAINGALDGLQYQASPEYSGNDTLTVTTGSATAEANLYARYEFVDGLSTDVSGNGRDGDNFVGAPVLTVDAERGHVTTVDGDDRIQATNAISGLTEQVSIAAWVKLATGQTDNTFVSIGDEVYVILDPSNPSYGIGGRVGGFTSYSLNSSHRVADDTWHHVALTLDDASNSLHVYLDGVLTRSSSFPGMEAEWLTAASQDIIVGALSDGSRAFVGSIDDVSRL